MFKSVNPASRQWEIIDLVARKGPITLAGIAGELGLAKTSIRQQMDRIVSAGWIDRTSRRGSPGRPADVFSLSDQSRVFFSHTQTDDLLRDLLDEIGESDCERSLKMFLDGVRRRLVQRIQSTIDDDATPQERLAQVAHALAERGAVNDVVQTEHGSELVVHSCPYHGFPKWRHLLCAMERKALHELTGLRIQHESCMKDGDQRCELRMEVGND